MPQMQTSISIDTDLVREIDQVAETDNRSRSNMISILIREALSHRETSESSVSETSSVK